MIKIAVDGMGGDYAPEPIVKGTLLALTKYENIAITIFGDKDKMAPFLEEHPRLTVVHTPFYLEMGEEDPIKQYRTNKEFSMFKALQALKDKEVDAVVSAGPTQALVVGGHFIVRRMKQIRKIAIAPMIPSYDGRGRYLLDSGAHVDVKAEHMRDLAIYATIVCEQVLKREKPTTALINIGSEPSKGRELDIEAYHLLSNDPNINFYGNLEPKEVFTTEADILLSDGFTGNIVMKTMEGTAVGLGKVLKREIKSSFRSKIGALFMRKALNNFKKSLDASEIGGALLMGLDGIVIKAQGASKEHAFLNGIRQAKEMVEADVINKVATVLNQKDEENS